MNNTEVAIVSIVGMLIVPAIIGYLLGSYLAKRHNRL